MKRPGLQLNPWLLNLNVTKQFYSDLHRKPEYKTTDTADFYGKPDIRYYLDDYVRFPNNGRSHCRDHFGSTCKERKGSCNIAMY